MLEAWDRQCAFCGYDGQITGASVAIEAAHVRWFAFDGPDTLDNGLALCALHHKLFDLGALGLNPRLQVMVSATFSARTGRWAESGLCWSCQPERGGIMHTEYLLTGKQLTNGRRT